MNERDIKKHELIGLEAEIVESRNMSQIGIKGKVIDETQKMIKIETEKEEKKIAKEGSVFVFTLPQGKKVEIKGDEIKTRPEERIRKC